MVQVIYASLAALQAMPEISVGDIGIATSGEVLIGIGRSGAVTPALVSAGATGVSSVNGDTGAVTLGLGDIDGVDLSTPPTDGQALVWDNGAGDWVPGTVSGGGGGATVIDDLTDVDTTSSAPTSGQALVWNGVDTWVPGDVNQITNLNDLGDVEAGSPTDGQALLWDNGAGDWVPGDVSQVAVLDDLSDVDTTSSAPTSGQALVWSGSAWVPGDLAAALNDLIDLNVPAPNDGDTLLFNSGSGDWEAAAALQTDLSGTPYALGKILAANGANYVDFAAGTDGQVLSADSGQASGLAWIDAYSPPSPAALSFTATTQAWDLSTHPKGTLVMNANTTLQLPSNGVVGETYTLLARASGAARTLSFVTTYVNAFDNTSLTSLVIPDGQFRALSFMWDSGRMRLIGAGSF